MKTEKIQNIDSKKEWVKPAIVEISKKVILKITGAADKVDGNTSGNPKNFTYRQS